MKDTLFMSRSDNWETPQYFFDEMDREFHFTLDSCADADNAKCVNYFTKQEDALKQEWNGRVWCNPPYGRRIGKWIKKAIDEIRSNAELIVMLIPARTDTRWFHDYIYKNPNVEIRFIKGRIKFGGSVENAPFPSMIVIFRKEKHNEIDRC